MPVVCVAGKGTEKRADIFFLFIFFSYSKLKQRGERKEERKKKNEDRAHKNAP
jgi:hypothetical protein